MQKNCDKKTEWTCQNDSHYWVFFHFQKLEISKKGEFWFLKSPIYWFTLFFHTAGSDTIFIQIYMAGTPRGARGVKRTGRVQGSIPWCGFAIIFSPNRTNFKKPHKIKKIHQKWLFCNGFSEFVQLGLNISAKKCIKLLILILSVFLTPLAPLCLFLIFLSGGTPYNFFSNTV